MRQAENDHNNMESASKESGNAEKPRSWREYIEKTEAAEKKAEREAARERAIQIKKEKNPVSAWKDKAQAALNEVKAAGRRTAEAEPAKEQAVRAETEKRPAGDWKNKAMAALDSARPEEKEEQIPAQEKQPAKTRAVQAAESVKAAVSERWERVQELTADGRERVSDALDRVREVVGRHPVSPLLYVTLIVVIAGVFAFKGSYTRAYALSYNGQEIAVVSSQEDVDAIVSSVESRASDILGEEYTYDTEKISTTPVYVTPDEVIRDTTEVEDVLFEDVNVLVQAWGLRVDGVELGYAAAQEDLQALLDEAAAPYLTEDTVSYEFVEDVEVYPIDLPSNTQYDLESIQAILSELRVEESTYVVKKGDTFNAIAYSLDMWPNELSVLNPDVIVDKLWVDQELVIQQAVPFLSVQNFTDETYEEAIASPVEYIETADLYVGETKVKEQGADGLQMVNARVTYVNGVEVDREVLSTEVLEEPTTTYAYTGTTPRPVTASNGYFIWPVRGTITSNFGGRNLWGSYDFHLGLDIAVPMGTSVKAADGGTVIKAGWSGSYGNLVAIRHDNGYVTYYAHNSSILVSVGDKVYQGQVISRAGSTGNSSGPHCHFEVRINGTSVNPRNYLS